MEETKEKEGEAVDQKVKSGSTSLPTKSVEEELKSSLTIEEYKPDMKITRERIEKHKDEKEEETGKFHWMFGNGRYTAIDELTDEQVQRNARHCEKKMCELQSYIEVLVDQMCGWQYRLEHLEEEALKREIPLEGYQKEEKREKKDKSSIAEEEE